MNNINRAEFEAFMRTECMPLVPEWGCKTPSGAYRSPWTESNWRTWQAARAQPVEPQIDGYPLWSGLPPTVERVALSDAGLQCEKCGADRLKEKCKRDDDKCPFLGIAYSNVPIAQPLIAEAARDDVFMINSVPLYDVDLSLVCDYLTHETAFNGAAILSGWNELKRRAIAAVKRDDVAGDANGKITVLADLLRDVLMPLSVSKMDAMTSGEEDDYRMIGDLEKRIKAAIAASTANESK